MINLLPDEVKESIIYGRRNRGLLYWTLALASASLGILVVVWFGQLYIKQTQKQFAIQVEQSRTQLKVKKLEETQKQVEDIANSLKLVVQVLSREILFSKLLRQVGAVMPSGSILTDLTISKVQGGLDLSAQAIDYNTATQIQLNLADPASKLFQQADLISITCSSAAAENGGPAKYPCQVQIRALFAKDNPFLFINTNKAKP